MADNKNKQKQGQINIELDEMKKLRFYLKSTHEDMKPDRELQNGMLLSKQNTCI